MILNYHSYIGVSDIIYTQHMWDDGAILLCDWLDSTMRVSQVVKGEMSAKTTYQKSAKGPVSISECSPDGKYIMLENSGRKVRRQIQSLYFVWMINQLIIYT